MPGDIIGANLFNFQTSTFTLTRGPIFTDLLLADEINRAPPKTQAALLEAMQERTVTVDGETLPLGSRFMVVATQNPIEQQGVYPLPEAQLDRFLFKQTVDYPLRRGGAAHRRDARRAPGDDADRMGRREAAPMRRRSMPPSCAVAAIKLVDEVIDYITALIRATARRGRPGKRREPARRRDAGRRGARAGGAGRARLRAARRCEGPGPALLRHRLILSPAAEIDGRSIEDVLHGIIEAIEAPVDLSDTHGSDRGGGGCARRAADRRAPAGALVCRACLAGRGAAADRDRRLLRRAKRVGAACADPERLRRRDGGGDDQRHLERAACRARSWRRSPSQPVRW